MKLWEKPFDSHQVDAIESVRRRALFKRRMNSFSVSADSASSAKFCKRLTLEPIALMMLSSAPDVTKLQVVEVPVG